MSDISDSDKATLRTALTNPAAADRFIAEIEGDNAKSFASDVTVAGKFALSDIGTLASAGSAQSDAALLTNQITSVTGADGTKGVKLPAAVAGLRREVYNSVAANGLKIYPNTDDDINDGTANAAITIEGKTHAVFVALDASTWAATYTANT